MSSVMAAKFWLHAKIMKQEHSNLGQVHTATKAAAADTALRTLEAYSLAFDGVAVVGGRWSNITGKNWTALLNNPPRPSKLPQQPICHCLC